MNTCQKFLSTGVLALFASAAFAQAPTLGAASGFSVLGGTAVTCTDGVIIGDAGVSPGTAFTNTRCTISGTTHVDDQAARRARAAFDTAYAALAEQACQFNLDATIAADTQLEPGVYCTDAALTATNVVLTLDGKGDPNAVWIFRIGTNPTGTGALTGTGFTVTMADGGQACNVYWRVAEAVDLTDSVFKGTVLAGAAITTTRGTVAGRALARAAVTITGTTVTGCDVLSEDGVSCKPKKHHKHKKGHDRDDDDDDGDRHHDDDDDDDDDGGKKGNRGKHPFKK